MTGPRSTFPPPTVPDDNRTRLLADLLPVGRLVALAAAVAAVVAGLTGRAPAEQVLATLGLALGFWGLSRVRWLGFTGRALLFPALILGLVLLAALRGGALGQARLWLALLVLLLLALWGRRVGLLAGAVAIAASAAMGWWQGQGLLASNLTPMGLVPWGSASVTSWLGGAFGLSVAAYTLIQVRGRIQSSLHQQRSLANALSRERATLAERVMARRRAIERSSEVSQRLAQILDPDELITVMANAVHEAFAYYQVQIYLYDPARRQLDLAGASGPAAATLLARRRPLAIGEGLVGRAARTRHLLLVPDVTVDPGWSVNPLLPDTRAEVAVPILLSAQLLGVLNVQQDRPTGLTEDDVAALQSIASQLAVALANARLYARIQRRADQEVAVSQTARYLQDAGSIEDVLQIAAHQVREVARCDRVTIQIGAAVQPAGVSPPAGGPGPR